MNSYILEKIKNDIIKNQINIVGIHGPQGIGKTTLNNFLYDELSKDFS